MPVPIDVCRVGSLVSPPREAESSTVKLSQPLEALAAFALPVNRDRYDDTEVVVRRTFQADGAAVECVLVECA